MEKQKSGISFSENKYFKNLITFQKNYQDVAFFTSFFLYSF